MKNLILGVLVLGVIFAVSYKPHIQISANKVLAAETRVPASLAADQKLAIEQKVYCSLLKTKIPLGGELKIYTLKYQADENGQSGVMTMIHSSDCPNPLFSKVNFYTDGSIKNSINCKETTAEDLTMVGGIQGNIKNIENKPHHLNLAISGPGYFVAKCTFDTEMTRDGRFLIAKDGTVMTAEEGGCDVLRKDGEPMKLTKQKKIDDSGCSKDGQCLAMVLPEKGKFTYINHKNLRLVTDTPTLINDVQIFSDAFEDLDDGDGGIMGPNWERVALLIKPETCPASIDYK